LPLPFAFAVAVVAVAVAFAFVYAPIPAPQTIFQAFTQQNRMSSPQTHQKPNNPFLINKIKLPPKWFLVMLNPVQLN
jgi:hypothetical protein